MSSDAPPKQGEIWLVDFDPSVGSEMQKIRPAVVVSDNSAGKLPLRIVVPITDWKEHYADFPWFTELQPTTANGLSKASGADGFSVKSVSLKRFSKKLGTVTGDELQDIHYTIVFCLGLG
jgi:mRNA interferase MazF